MLVAVVLAVATATATGTTASANVKKPSFGHALLPRFRMSPNLTNLNQGSYGVVARDVFSFQASLLARVEEDPEQWFRVGLQRGGEDEEGCTAQFQCELMHARRSFAEYLGVAAADLLFVDNASEGVNIALRSVAHFLGSERRGVLYLDIAYGMVKDCIRFLAGDIGGAANTNRTHPVVARATAVNTSSAYPHYDGETLLALVEAAILANKRNAREQQFAIASFSHIASVPGIVLPIQRLAELCHSHGIIVMVDGAHAPGQIALDVGELGVDIYIGNGHKWMFTARGCAFLWVSPTVQELIYPTVIEEFPGYAPKTVRATAGSLPYPAALHSMFDWQGTKDYSAYLSVTAALAFRRSLGSEHDITSYMHNLAVAGGEMLAHAWGTQAMPASVIGAMANVELPCRRKCPDDLATRLYEKYMFFVPVVSLPGGSLTPSTWIRISTGVYTSMVDFERVRDAVLKELHVGLTCPAHDCGTGGPACPCNACPECSGCQDYSGNCPKPEYAPPCCN